MKRNLIVTGFPVRDAWRNSTRCRVSVSSISSKSRPGRWAYDYPVSGATLNLTSQPLPLLPFLKFSLTGGASARPASISSGRS
jgi:hypothetical protein